MKKKSFVSGAKLIWAIAAVIMLLLVILDADSVILLLAGIVLVVVALVASMIYKTAKAVRGSLNTVHMGGGTAKRSNNPSPQNDDMDERPVQSDIQSAEPIVFVQPSPELMQQLGKAKSIGMLCYVVFGIAIVAAIIIMSVGNWMGILVALVAAAALMGGISYMSKATNIFKANLVRDMLNTAFEELTYQPSMRSNIDDVQVFASVNRTSGGDHILARYHGRVFEQSDIEMYYVTTYKDSDGDTQERSELQWSGRVMVMENQTQFDEPVQVISCDLANTINRKKNDSSGWEEITMELEDFNKLFNVYSTNPLAAMSALTPQIQEKIIRLNDAMNRPMVICFQNDKLYMFISIHQGEDHFEVNPSKSTEENVKKLAQDIQFIRDILDII